MSAINKFPVELLDNIFKNLRHATKDSEEHRGKVDNSPDSFPYDVADVCCTWRVVLSRNPTYWTRVFLDVNHSPSLPLDIFSWSNDQPISVTILSQFDSGDPRKQEREQHQLSKITTALLPHLNRCHDISIQATYGSSLPSPTIFFLQDMPLLTSLRLDSKVDDDIEKLDRTRTLATSFPKFKNLLIHGRAFMELCRTYPKWHRATFAPFGLNLTLTQYKIPQGTDHPREVVAELIKYLMKMKLCHLEFQRFSLGYSPQKRDKGAKYRVDEFFIDFFHLQEVDAAFFAEFSKTARGKCGHVTISHSVLTTPLTFLSENNLLLEGIKDKDTLKHALLEFWGTSLTVLSCPAFDDDLLRWLTTGGPNYYLCPAGNIEELNIESCSNITPAVLKSLIHRRNEIAGVEVGDFDEHARLPSLQTVFITTNESPLICEEDREWFEERMDDICVSWKVELPDGTTETIL